MGITKKKIFILGAIISILVLFWTVWDYLPLIGNYPTNVKVMMNQNDTGNLFLTVGNNSPQERLVDIAVYIDDKLVLKGNFEKGDILPFIANYKTFRFSLSNGTHKFYAESLVGRVQSQEELEINGTAGVIVGYEHDPQNISPDRHIVIWMPKKGTVFE